MKHQNKAHIRNITLLMLVGLTILSLSGCQGSSPEATVRQYETAMNKADTNAMLSCLEPNYAQSIKALSEIADNIEGSEGSSLISMLPLMEKFKSENSDLIDIVSSEGKVKYTLKVIKTTTSGDIVSLQLTASGTVDGKPVILDSVCTLIKADGRWLITSLQ